MKGFVTGLLLIAAPALSAEPMVSFSAGHIGVMDDLTRPQWYGVEYRWEPFSRWNITPGAGFHRANCGANFVYLDLRKHWWLSERWALTPHFGPGVWHDSDQVKLGHDLQFRSGIELVFRARNDMRFGIGISHLSNGSLGRLNPGTETISVSYSMPLS